MNHSSLNLLFLNHYFQRIFILVVHRHSINILCHLRHFCIILFMDHQPIHHSIVCHQTIIITLVTILLDHQENISMNNNSIKIFFTTDFFKLLLTIDNSSSSSSNSNSNNNNNNNYHLTVSCRRRTVYGVLLFDLFLVSTKFFLSTSCKRCCNSILSKLITRLVTSNYNRLRLIALTFLTSYSLTYILQLKVKMCMYTHTYIYIYIYIYI